uniref:Fatty acid desaturase domain-containing protein n=1 Tax=Alexandrium monilatum TaxID=311494 RepID=A0A7S4QL05_9DINO
MAQVQGRSAGAAEPAESAALLVRRHCSKYGPNDLKALRTSLITFGLLYAFLALVLACPCRLAAGLLGLAIVRAFVLFHDAAHGSLTTSRAANKVVAWMVSPWIGRTSAGWSASHEQHHKILGSDPPPFNAPALAFAGLAIGDDGSRTVFFTKQEFDSWPIHQQGCRRSGPFVRTSMWRLCSMFSTTCSSTSSAARIRCSASFRRAGLLRCLRACFSTCSTRSAPDIGSLLRVAGIATRPASRAAATSWCRGG